MELAHSTIAVTGATGFLGGYLVDRFLDHGAHVVAVVRNPAKAAPLQARGVEIRRADLADAAALAEGFRGVDAVIANAAQVSFTRPRETFQVNLEGTRNVFWAMHAAGVGRAVLVSSSVVYPLSLRRLDEEALLRASLAPGRVDGYAASKAAAEREAWSLAARHGIALTTVRPCAITGPHDPLLMRAFLTLMDLPVAPYPVGGRIGVAHGQDVAEAIALALTRPERSVGRAYNLAGETTSFGTLLWAFRAAGGRTPRALLPFPAPLFLRYDDTRARRELGWRPRSVAAIMAEVARQPPTGDRGRAHNTQPRRRGKGSGRLQLWTR